MADQAFNWRPMVERRILVAAAMFVLWTIAIEARLIYLQVIDHERLVLLQTEQRDKTIDAPAKRGELFDRHGRLLAYSVDADTIYAVPTEVQDDAGTAAALCRAFDGCTAKERAALTERLKEKRAFTYVRRRVTPAEAGKVAQLDLKGVGFIKESRRFYPNRELGAHVLGYVGTDNIGLSGLEATYDKVIRGSQGKMLVQSDGKGRVFSRLDQPATTGSSLELTIDEQLQHIVERELRAGVEEKRADGGTAIVMDPNTGEILAMASWPTFNPNVFNGSSEASRRNRAVQDIYEPGSTFKVVTIAAALEEHVMSPEAMIDTSPGVYRMKGRVINEFEGHNYGVLSFTDVIVKSSNVGAIKIGMRLGAERMGLYVNRLGFGKPTSPDLPGESPGIVWSPSKLDESGLASMSMGYQVSVTPLQMTAAMNAVANGGTWIEPRLVRAVIKNGVRQRVEPKVVRRAISAETALRMVPILEGVVEDGTAKLARIPGFTVAGKTGTADKIVNGHYVGWLQNVSFLGFVPSRNPALTVIVMVDTPRVGSDTGGAVAAPIFKRIAEASLRHLGVAPNVNPAPPVMVVRRNESTVTPASTPVLLPSIVALASSAAQSSLVPDLRGLSARDALRTLGQLGLSARMRGNGLVVAQTPAAGTPLERGMTCTLVLDRELPRQSGAIGAQP